MIYFWEISFDYSIYYRNNLIKTYRKILEHVNEAILPSCVFKRVFYCDS